MHRPLVTAYVAVSREIENYLIEQINVAPERVCRICNGVDVHRFAPPADKRATRKLIGMEFPDDAIVIGTVGRLKAVKNQQLLADAFIRVYRRIPEFQGRLRLAIVGDGELRTDIADRFKDAGLTDVCWMPGYRNDIPVILQALDVFVLPSLAEGISNTILEAMASGLPVIATDVGGNGELIDDGSSGQILPDFDPETMSLAIERYVRDSEYRESHSLHARYRASQCFSIDSMVNQYAALYESVLGSA
jgi:sugar transferase (PEP-CTERM/EpsH1 system associated)